MAEASTFGVTTAQFAKPQLSMAFAASKRSAPVSLPRTTAIKCVLSRLAVAERQCPALLVVPVFSPVVPFKKRIHLVGVHKLRFPAAQAIHPDCRIILNLLMLEQLRAHQRNIIGRGYMILRGVIKARAIFKMRILHAKLSGALIAHGDEHFLTACQKLRQSNAGVVCRADCRWLSNSSSTVMTSPSLSQI